MVDHAKSVFVANPARGYSSHDLLRSFRWSFEVVVVELD
jgi:hypothetical protein